MADWCRRATARGVARATNGVYHPSMVVIGGNVRAEELVVGGIRLAAGVFVATLVYRFVRVVPWPRPFRLRFAGLHVIAAILAAAAWMAMSTPLELLVAASGSDLRGIDRVKEFMAVGMFLYAVIVAVSYAAEGSARAARAEAAAASTQLAALRAQLHPHFLFNALHTVVQLIPADPRRAAEAAELVGDLLRSTLEEKRDEVTLGEEWRFVSRYLELERIRFGDRLIVRSEIPEGLFNERVPSFAVQTLVENAVHHGAAPRIAPTEIVVVGARNESELRLSVRNPANGKTNGESRVGTGLPRLRERLSVLYGKTARLESGPIGDGEYESVLVLPVRGRES
jgi:two-component system LytT family sensor kinase